MNKTFNECKKLKEIKFPKTYTNELVYMHKTFYKCSEIEKIDLFF